jgi:hypothetical protein
MGKITSLTGCLALCAAIFLPVTARAAFHLWDISEIYSNSSGSVQFIELFTGSFGQTLTSGTQITSNTHTFTFSSNITTPPDTNGRHLLLATAGFGALAGGVTPDFTIPSSFFSPLGDHITYQGAAGNKTFGPLPTDGVLSLTYGRVTGPAANSPTNYAGMTGSVHLAPEPAGIVLLVLGAFSLAAVFVGRGARRRRVNATLAAGNSC